MFIFDAFMVRSHSATIVFPYGGQKVVQLKRGYPNRTGGAGSVVKSTGQTLYRAMIARGVLC